MQNHIIWDDIIYNIRKFIMKRIHNEHDAEDVLQEVLLKIYANIERIENESKIYAWVYQITRNAIIDYYRKKKYTFELFDLPETIPLYENEEKVIDELAICIKSMVNHLPEKYKQAIMLTELGNLTQKDLAVELNMSISGAKSRVQRARKMLKEMLLECCECKFDTYGNIIEYLHKHNNSIHC